MYKMDLEKAEEQQTKLPIFVRYQKKQENSRYTSTSASLTIIKPLIMWITTFCGIDFLWDWNEN